MINRAGIITKLIEVKLTTNRLLYALENYDEKKLARKLFLLSKQLKEVGKQLEKYLPKTI